MTTRRTSIRLNDHERKLLEERYLEWRIPIDQFEARPEDFTAFTSEWNRLSGRHDSKSDLLHYMRTKRKNGRWVTLNGRLFCASWTLSLKDVLEFSTDIREKLNVEEKAFDA